MNEINIKSAYSERYPRLDRISTSLEQYIKDLFSEFERIDRISARAKNIERFIKKALSENDDSKKKYSDPINQIQDQIGARITAFYLSDVEAVCNNVTKYFKAIEIQSKIPESNFAFGYFGEHFILKLPDDVLSADDGSNVPEFFELQFKTLFQHAWSEAHHDLGYKSPRPLTNAEQRKTAFTAAQAWGADKIFQELTDALQGDNDDVDHSVSG